MYELIYTSVARRYLTHSEVEEMVESARSKNQRLGITGLLLYSKYEFIQLLEGEERVVRQLFEEIQADSRHDSVTSFYEGYIEKRGFDGWSMAFKDLDAEAEMGIIDGSKPSFPPEHPTSFANLQQNAGKKIFRMLSEQL